MYNYHVRVDRFGSKEITYPINGVLELYKYLDLSSINSLKDHFTRDPNILGF